MRATDAVRARLVEWLSDRPDDHVLRWLFGAMLAASVGVLALDYAQMLTPAEQKTALTRTSADPAVKPSAEPLPARRGGDERRRGPLRTADKRLAATMTFELEGDGRLVATGTIMPGAADAFAAEIGKRGGYIKTVVLH